MERPYDSLESVVKRVNRKYDLNMSDTIADFDRLRLSAFTKAAELSPFVKEVTIGPRSPEKHTIEQTTPDIIEVDKGTDLLEDKIDDELRYTLLLKQFESQMQQLTEERFKNLVEKMIAQRADTLRGFGKKQSDECERKEFEVRARKLCMIKKLRENDNLPLLDKAKLDEQKCQMINQQTIENMNRILEEQNMATARFASITDSHTRICRNYYEITIIIQTEPQAQDIIAKYAASISAVILNVTTIMEFCKTDTITDKEVKQAEILSLNIENIKRKILEELQEVKDQELLRKKQEDEEVKKIEEQKRELEERLAQEAKAAEIAKEATHTRAPAPEPERLRPMFYSQKNYAHYKDLKSFLDEYENKYKELLLDPNLKKFRFDCQKAVNTPVNAISAVSGMHMKDKFEKLSKLLRGESVQVLDTYVTASMHPQGLYYCTALLAKKIIQQGDRLVSSNSESAFPIAAVIVALWSEFPEFGKLLEANFHRQCPYIVPMLLPQQEGQTDKEFYMSRGYTYNDEGVVEKQDKFLKRISGIFRLQCAIWIAKTPRYVNKPNPHGLRHAWQWLASFINLKPEPDISATLLNDFFTVCGSDFFKYYRNQFAKIIKLISTEYFTILANIDEGGPKTRLEVFLQNVLQSGQIPPPTGLLPPNF